MAGRHGRRAAEGNRLHPSWITVCQQITTEDSNIMVLIHQPIRRLFVWTLIIISILLTQTIAQAAQVTIAWDPNDPAPDGYRVYARAEGQNYDYTSPVWPQSGDDPTQTTCTIDDLVEGTSYYFVVRAYVGTAESDDSNEVNHISEAAQSTTYTISTNAGTNGTISPTSATVNAGDSQTFTITPDTGYHVEDVLEDGISVGSVAEYSFSNVTSNHNISASFKPIDGGDLTLSVNAYKIKGDKYAELTWSKEASMSVDVYRNGGIVARGISSGAYTHGPFSQGKPATYQVCSAGTLTCSNEVTVSW